MKLLKLTLCVLLCAAAAFGQTALGTITGIVADPTGAVIANASIEIRNAESGQLFAVSTTESGNYTVNQLPVGRYELNVNVAGFKKFSRQNLSLAAAQVMRVDVPLEVGSNAETVTVTAESTLLKTESSDLTHNVTVIQLQNLPILPVQGAGTGSSSGFRDPFALLQLIPGTQYTASTSMVVNGLPANSEAIVIEGANVITAGSRSFSHQTQPSVDAIQEVAVQTSNFAAEFGTVGGGIINLTMKSGGNAYHGSAYDYAVNDGLNAAQPYTGLKGPAHRNDYGGTLGGPVRIPKIYNGTNKTFFFFNFEEFRNNERVATQTASVPTDAYRVGNFTEAICRLGTITTGCGAGQFTPKLAATAGSCTTGTEAGCYIDPLGRTVAGGQIFDPKSDHPVICNSTLFPNSTCAKLGQNGTPILTREPFAVNNVVPANYFDPVALRVLNYVPKPQGVNWDNAQAFKQGSSLSNNYINPWLSHRTSEIPSIKLDHQTGSKGHASFYWHTTNTEAQFAFPNGNSVGLPVPIDPARGTWIYSPQFRGNYDYTLTPTILLHFGVGFTAEDFWDYGPTSNYNPDLAQTCKFSSAQAGFQEAALAGTNCTGGLGPWNTATGKSGIPGPQSLELRVPSAGGMFPQFIPGTNSTAGGMTSTGTAGAIHSSGFTEHRPSANFNATWARGNHTYKIGFDGSYAQIPTHNLSNTSGTFTFGGGTLQPAITSIAGVTLATGSPTAGLNFADFLMGNMAPGILTAAASLAAGADSSNRKYQFAMFLQDTWKVTRKLTFDYGLRWDYGTYAKEQYGRSANFSGLVANASAGNHPGGQIFEATCNCAFADNYPYAVGPRVGIAYQINSKTVIRSGLGLVYNATSANGGTINNSISTGALSPAQILPTTLSQGLPAGVAPVWPAYNANLGQLPGTVVAAPTLLDRNAGRPARQIQFNFSIQREITRNFVLEASYVANRGYWWSAGALSPGANDLSVAYLSKLNFSIPNTADSSLLRSSSWTAAQLSTLASKGIAQPLPYSNFPISGPNTQSVRQSIRAFPQYTSALTPTASPLGKTWYDALQITVTKRLSHGLSVNANYTYSKTMSLMSSPDVFNPGLGKDLGGTDLPHQFRLSAEYTVPRQKTGLFGNKIVSWIVSDWGLGAFIQYQSAAILGKPNGAGSDPITNYIIRGSLDANRTVDANGNPTSIWSTNWVDYDGVTHTDPLDINCHCFNPQTTNVFNSKANTLNGNGVDAWSAVTNGQWSDNFSSLRDFRGFRRPQENFNVSRNFRIKERVNFQIRAEWLNAFNRLLLPQPSTAGFTTAPTRTNGIYTAGYGTIVPGQGTSGQRTGLVIARLTF